MYYYRACTYCAKIYYTYNGNKEEAARIIYEGLKAHLQEWNEDHKEYELDEAPEIEVDQMYYEMIETEDEPAGAYEL